MMKNSLIRLQPRNEYLYVSRNRSVLVTDRNGFITPDSEMGFFVHQTRLLSLYRYLIDDEEWKSVALSNVRQHEWQGYYIQLPPELKGKSDNSQKAQQSLELLVNRKVAEGLCEELCLTNYTQSASVFCFSLELDADFADQDELSGNRQQRGGLRQAWRKRDECWELRVDYRAEHHYEHQGDVGDMQLYRGLLVRIRNATTEPYLLRSRIAFDVKLDPHQSWRACVEFLPLFEDMLADSDSEVPCFNRSSGRFDELRDEFWSSSTSVEIPACTDLAAITLAVANRSQDDLAALRRYGSSADQGWTLAAGVPKYLALFGRDPLIAGSQAEMFSTEMLRGALYELAQYQADSQNDWRDASPNAMLHQARGGPLSILNFNPLGRYYGTLTCPSWYPIGLAEYWRWSGDLNFAGSLLETALRCVRWMEEHARSPRHGFFQYQTRSEQGIKNQGWKDSSDAIVYADGSQVDDPIAPCEVQGYYYGANEQLAQLLWMVGRRDEAVRLRDSAIEFKKRFNDVFWMEAEQLFALGLDGGGRQIRSVASNAAHCLGAGIIDAALAPKVADRLFEEDMFSGWGLRTLSSRHPAYNPYSYHRGSVWPVEQGSLAIGLRRYSRVSHLLRLSEALIELASLFEFCRLPEVLSGHPRNQQHPFPALYPQANSPQAWSASAIFAVLSSILGLFPWAPFGILFVDPQLPVWLPEIVLRNLAIGQASVDIRFFRDDNQICQYEVLALRGTLKVLRRSDAWTLLGLPGDALQNQLTALSN
jgi:glycogen debranching enzyme